MKRIARAGSGGSPRSRGATRLQPTPKPRRGGAEARRNSRRSHFDLSWPPSASPRRGLRWRRASPQPRQAPLSGRIVRTPSALCSASPRLRVRFGGGAALHPSPGRPPSTGRIVRTLSALCSASPRLRVRVLRWRRASPQPRQAPIDRADRSHPLCALLRVSASPRQGLAEAPRFTPTRQAPHRPGGSFAPSLRFTPRLRISASGFAVAPRFTPAPAGPPSTARIVRTLSALYSASPRLRVRFCDGAALHPSPGRPPIDRADFTARRIDWTTQSAAAAPTESMFARRLPMESAKTVSPSEPVLTG